MTDTTSDEQLLADLGVEIESEPQFTGSVRESRIIACFEEIERFFELNRRAPTHGENKDIFERIYAVRLDKIRTSEECLSVLNGKDKFGLLKNVQIKSGDTDIEKLGDEELLANLGAIPPAESDITKLKHVRTRAEIKAAEEMARRIPCTSFDKFKPLFDQVQKELKEGDRHTIPYKYGSKVNAGDLYILGGQKVYVADVGTEIIDEDDKTDRRLRVIFDNGTESNLLLRSLQRALIKDTTSRRITDNTLKGSLFSGIPEVSDTASGTIYILRSKSDNPIISKNRDVIHKIGVTSDDVKKRLSIAKLDPTFLMAEVELIATYELANMSRAKVEGIIHKFFDLVRLEIEIKDRFGNPVAPREWFLVPLSVIDEAIERIKDGSITRCRYDAKIAKIVENDQL